MNRRESEEAVTIVLPCSEVGPVLDRCLDALAASEGMDALAVEVIVVLNGQATDRADAVSETSLSQRGWNLRVVVSLEPGKAAALRLGEAAAAAGRVIMLDLRVAVSPRALAKILDEQRENNLRLASGHLRYSGGDDPLVRRFARAYGRSPYARSDDLKGACVLFASDARSLIREMPDITADDRYLLASVPRRARSRIRGAYVDYEFRPGLGNLLRQQARWTASNRTYDREHADYDRNEHESDRGPHLPPDVQLRDRVVYYAVLAIGNAWGRIRPPSVAW